MPPPNTPEDMEQELQRSRARTDTVHRHIEPADPQVESTEPAVTIYEDEQLLDDTIEVNGQIYYWPTSSSIDIPTSSDQTRPSHANSSRRRSSSGEDSRSRSTSRTPTRSRRAAASSAPSGNGHGTRRLRKGRADAPRLDLAALEYAGEHDDNLDCPICQFPFVDPHVIQCGHVFCASCLDKTLEHNTTCPIDRSKIEYCFKVPGGKDCAIPAPRIIRNQLDDLQVRCPNKPCGHICARSFMKHHYNKECPYTKVRCPDVSCEKFVARLDAGEGLCLHQEVKCSYCDKPVELASLEEHYEADCQQRAGKCDHCNAEIKHHQLRDHLKTCSGFELPCQHAASGCPYKEKRRDFQVQHERTCLYGVVSNMQQQHRHEMDQMGFKLAQAEEQMRKLSTERAAAPASPSCKVGSPLANLHLGGSPGSRSPTDRRRSSVHREQHGGPVGLDSSSDEDQPISAEARHQEVRTTLDLFDAKLENVHQCLSELDVRSNALVMNEIMPLKDQVNVLRSDVGHIGMHVRWLLELHQKKQRAGSAAASTATMNGGGSTASGRTTSDVGSTSSSASTAAGQHEGQVRYAPRRQMSGENPPRL